MSDDEHAAVRQQIGEIEAEMRRLGMFDTEPPPPEAFDSRVAFFGDTMAFEQWLRFVLLPRVQAVLDGEGSFPAQSMVGAQAVREFDGHPDADDLVSLLSTFDGLIVSQAGVAGPEGTAAVEEAAGRGDADAVAANLAAGASGSAQALTWAASSGSWRAVADLVNSGIDPNVQDVYGVTPIFFAAGYGHVGICAWLIDPDGTTLSAALWGEKEPLPGHLDILRILIDRGATFDAPYSPLGGYESGGATPLILAAALGHEAAVDELLRMGASRTAADVKGRTAADWAQRRHKTHLVERLQPD